jgi:acyl-CoA synthetase (AMP-forming)/AMP-acid ligase II
MPTREEVVAALTGPGAGMFELKEDRALGYPIRVYAHAPPSLRVLFEATRAYGDRLFLMYEDETLTFEQHYRKVASLAHYLIAQGVRKGDRVAIGMRNYPEWIISFWACQVIGAISVSLNAWWTGPELEYALKDSAPAALLIDGERFERIAPLLRNLDIKTILVARADGMDFAGVDFDKAADGAATELPAVDIGPEDLATILYTSGTTGNPKGAVANQRNHVTNIYNTMLGGQIARHLAGLADQPPDPDAPQPGALQTFPFFHIGGLSGLYVSTVFGSKLALMYKWVPAEGVRLVETYKLSSVAGAPIVVRQLLETAMETKADISSLIGIASGGAPVPPDLVRTIGERFEQKAAPGNGYGLTETTSAIIANSGADYLANPESVGRPAATADIRIVDDDGNEAPQGSVGEVWIRGPNVIPGYWNNPEATEAAFGGGWFRSGDLGYRDAEGFYYVVDRKKDVIIRGGENVYCAEVEAALLEHPLVKDATVVGVPDKMYGEEVGALVQVRAEDNRSGTVDELKESLGPKLARFKIPTFFELTEEDLPRTATGKVLKREIREKWFAPKR